MNRTKTLLWLTLSLALLIICASGALCIGSVYIPVRDWFGLEKDSIDFIILTQLRLPRALTALAVGGMLSLSGCVLQGIFKNPLVEPYTLGLSGGASLGVAAAFAFGATLGAGTATSLAALIGSLLISALLLLYYKIRPHINNLLLSGIMLGILCSSCTTLIMSLSSPEQMTRIVYWTMGSLEGCETSQAGLLCGFAGAGLVLCTLLSQRLNLLGLGMEQARHLGVNTRRLVPAFMLITSCMTALSVAAAGIIGFAGLIVPHILRRLAGNDYRLLVPCSFLCGGAFMLLCDLIARTVISPSQLPIGVVTGMAGGSIFVYLLLKRTQRRHHA